MDETAGSIESEIILESFSFTGQCKVDTSVKIYSSYYALFLCLGIWVWLTALPTLILNSQNEDTEIGRRDYIGWSMWLIGMLIEATADYQKYTFRSNPANRLE